MEIRKITIPYASEKDKIHVALPTVVRFLNIDAHDGGINVYMMVDEKTPIGKWRFTVVGTGSVTDEVSYSTYVGSFHTYNFMFHVFALSVFEE